MESLFVFFSDCLNKAKGDIAVVRHGHNGCMAVFADFLRNDIKDWQAQKPEQLVIDFIAGMTDSYFNQAFIELFLPSGTV